jgi:hypothetical protein
MEFAGYRLEVVIACFSVSGYQMQTEAASTSQVFRDFHPIDCPKPKSKRCHSMLQIAAPSAVSAIY